MHAGQAPPPPSATAAVISGLVWLPISALHATLVASASDPPQPPRQDLAS